MVSTNRPRDFELIFWNSPLTCHNPDGKVKGGGLWRFQEVCFWCCFDFIVKSTLQNTILKRIFNEFSWFLTKFSSKINLCNKQNYEISPKFDILAGQGWSPKNDFFIKNHFTFIYLNQNSFKYVKKAMTSKNSLNIRCPIPVLAATIPPKTTT